MVKGPIVETDFAQKCGAGTAMFSRPGKATSAEYICFKEEHRRVEEPEDEAPEEVQKEQLKNDMKGVDINAHEAYKMQVQLEEQERHKKPKERKRRGVPELHEQGENGNTGAFRNVPRNTLID